MQTAPLRDFDDKLVCRGESSAGEVSEAALLKLARWCQERRTPEQGSASCLHATRSPPPSALLNGSRSLTPTPIRPDQLWRQLGATQQQSIASVLAQMIARQIAAMPAPLFKEEHHE